MPRRLALVLSALCLLAPLVGCSSSSTDARVADSGAPVTDSGGSDAADTATVPVDSGAIDGAPADSSVADSATGDSSVADSATGDSSVADSATGDTGGAGDAAASCNDLAFGKPASIYISVPASSLGALTGGSIVDGTYDLVAVETSSTTIPASYTMRATWRFAGGTLDQLDQLQTSSLGPLTHRSGSISVAGATLTRTYACGSTDTAPAGLNFDASLVSGVQTVRIQSGALRLTFEKRP